MTNYQYRSHEKEEMMTSHVITVFGEVRHEAGLPRKAPENQKPFSLR
jgi:hypothetical protein